MGQQLARRRRFPGARVRAERGAAKLLLAASYRFSETATTGEAADVLADVACSLTGAAGAHVYVFEEPGSAVLVNANAVNTTAERGCLQVDTDGEAADLRTCMDGGVPVFVPDGYAAGQARQSLRSRFGTASLLFTPLTDVGVLVLWWSDRRDRAPAITDQLGAFTAHAAQVLRRRIDAEVLRGQTLTDPLTALANRRALRAALSELPPGGTLVLLDLDHFKALNDEHGHRHGDLVLQGFARSLQELCPAEGCAARYGGEEFALVLPAGGEALARHLVTRLRRAWVGGGLTFSAGVAVQRHGAAPEETLEAADQALYAAKRAGRNTLVMAPDVVWEEESTSTARLPVARREGDRPEDLDLALLDEALAHDLVEPYFQPVMSTRTGRVVATEALARIRHPRTGELLLPAQFLPLAERTGRVGRVDWAVAEKAIGCTARWRDSGIGPDLSVGVNVSVAHLADPDLTARLLDACSRHGLSTGALVIEVTETMQSLRGQGHEQTLEQLAAAGVNIALDDFGTGFAALSYLLRFPIRGIKIDRTFTAALAGRRGREVVAAVIGMGQALGLHTVAEGVETEEQLRQLTDMGCPYVQGYLLGRPVPAVQVPSVIAALDLARAVAA